MFTIEQEPDGWVLYHDGARTAAPCPTYAEALTTLASEASTLAEAEAPVASGVLTDRWSSPQGIAFNTPTGDGRDFSSVAWSWRDPDVSLLPLMFQDKTDMGHFGAQLAGYIAQLSDVDGTVFAEGAFYDSDVGRAARDLLLDGRRFGVSVDPGAVEATWSCLAEDDEGWCVEEKLDFQAYQVIGLTMTPFPAFAEASIALAGVGELAVAADDHAFTDDNGDGRCDACLEEDEDGNCTRVCDLTEAEHTSPPPAEAPPAPAAVIADRRRRTVDLDRPPSTWFSTPEPDIGDRLLVDQGGGRVACPLTITDDGRVFGHLASWGQCHVGYPGQCVEPPTSPSLYARFQTGEVAHDDGTRTLTGPLVVGTEHARLTLDAHGARDHYAHTGLAWGDVNVIEGIHGPWARGSIRSTVTPELLRVLRASTLSGDWRVDVDDLDLIGVLVVNTPGFPILRQALAAAALPEVWPVAMAAARMTPAGVVALTAAGQVRRCPDCQRRASQSARPARLDDDDPVRVVSARLTSIADTLAGTTQAIANLTEQVAAIELRTRHLRGTQAAHVRERLARSA